MLKSENNNEVVLPKTGRNHKLFGLKYLKAHKFRDTKWQPKDLSDQYKMLCNLIGKNQILENLKRIDSRNKQYEKLKLLRSDIVQSRNKLKIALHGDIQRTKNILQNHKELQRLYQHLSDSKMIEDIDQKTFVKRKELDRLCCRKNELSEKYKIFTLELAKLQDRIKYVDETELSDVKICKTVRVSLKNSETRTRAINTINKAYRKIIDIMLYDSMYFEPVLTELQDDFNEQASFINRTIRLGAPAIINLEQLTNEYNTLEEQTRNEMKKRMKILFEHRQRIQANNTRIRELVRKDNDFIVYPQRYDRETTSMTNLSNELNNVEKAMKYVKNITSCSIAEEVMPRIQKLEKDNCDLETALVEKELNRDDLIETNDDAQHLRESLQHNVTEVELNKTKEISNLKVNINMEKEKQLKIQEYLRKNGEIHCLIKSTFQHILKLLKYVGFEYAPEHKMEYPISDLNLPLLKFPSQLGTTAKHVTAKHGGTTTDGSKRIPPPPTPIEENPKLILKAVRERLNLLFKQYGQSEKSQYELDVAKKLYHKMIVDNLQQAAVATTTIGGGGGNCTDDVQDDTPLIGPSTYQDDDPNVPNRKAIKDASIKFVEMNKRNDED